MSTYSIITSGPSAKIAMLRALAAKALGFVADLLNKAKIVLSHSAKITRVAASTALAVLGSTTGYNFLRHTIRTVVDGVKNIAAAGLRLLGRAVGKLGRTVMSGIAVVSPATAGAIEHHGRRWIISPIKSAASAISSWTADLGSTLWQLSDTGLVRGVTTRVAQASGILLAVNTLTKGAVAAKLVQALPSAMEAVLFLTNPLYVAALVGGAFVLAMVVAGLRVLDGPEVPDPEAWVQSELLDPGTPALRTGHRTDFDLVAIAAQLHIEVTADGSVLVHGVPAELPDDLGLEVAHVAAEAATARLERILLHRGSPNRDDRRLLTKAAREAVRAHSRRVTAAA